MSFWLLLADGRGPTLSPLLFNFRADPVRIPPAVQPLDGVSQGGPPYPASDRNHPRADRPLGTKSGEPYPQWERWRPDPGPQISPEFSAGAR